MPWPMGWGCLAHIKQSMAWFIVLHDDVIKWKHFPRNWPFVRGIHMSPVNSSHKGQWRGALIYSLICVWINCWVNNREAGDLRRYRAHFDVIVKICESIIWEGFSCLTYYRLVVLLQITLKKIKDTFCILISEYTLLVITLFLVSQFLQLFRDENRLWKSGLVYVDSA